MEIMEMEFEIVGQDFKKAGEASFAIKHRLKLLGIPPEIVRRVATASYEAELNVIVYASSGTMKIRLDEKRPVADFAGSMKLSRTCRGSTAEPPDVRPAWFGPRILSKVLPRRRIACFFSAACPGNEKTALSDQPIFMIERTCTSHENEFVLGRYAMR